VLYIDGIDLLGAARTVVTQGGKYVATFLIGLKTGSPKAAEWGGKAAGMAAEVLFQAGANWLLVDFEAGDKEGPVEVTTSGPLTGVVSARHSGWADVKGKVDLSKYGWGTAESEFFVIVGPELLSAEVRRGALIIPKGSREVAVPLVPKGLGVTRLKLTLGGRTVTRTLLVGDVPAAPKDAIRLPATGYKVVRVPMKAAPATEDTQVQIAFTVPGVADLADDVIPVYVKEADRALTHVVVGYQPGEWKGVPEVQLPEGLRKALETLAWFKGEKFTGKRRFQILEDNPELGVRNVTLAFTLELTDKDKLKIAGMDLGFAAPNIVPGYKPPVDSAGMPREDVARLLEVGEQVEPATAELVAARLGVQAQPGVPIKQALQDAASEGGLGTKVKQFLLKFVTLSRQVEGLSAGEVHLGAEVCVPLTGKKSDLYSATSQAGGATIQVRSNFLKKRRLLWGIKRKRPQGYNLRIRRL
jgi:hypothetical protein